MRNVTILDPWTKVTDKDGTRNIRISLRPRGYYILFFVPFALVCLIHGFRSIMHLVATGVPDWSGLFSLYSLVFVAWMSYGARDEISVDNGHLRLRVCVFCPFGRWRNYSVEKIHRLGLSELGKGSRGHQRGPAALSFDFRNNYVLFGRSLDEKVARQILALIQEKLQLPEEPNTPQHSIAPEVINDQS